jgi:hypothetical protein
LAEKEHLSAQALSSIANTLFAGINNLEGQKSIIT